MQFERLKEYLGGPFQSIEGWCSAQLWMIIQPICEFQNSIGVQNPVAEIGVYHGKFFFGLLAAKQSPANSNYAIDVFGLQQFNLDGAGDGNLEIFRRNAVTHGFHADRIETLEIDSMALSDDLIEDIRHKSGGFSLFSVDGCHLPEHTVNDTEIAIKLTVPSGIVFVDDYTNPDWPGVQEGISKLYFNHYPRFVPLVVAHNKLFLCHLSYHSQYLELVRMRMDTLTIPYKAVRRFGYESLTIHLDPNDFRYIYTT